MRCAHPDEVKQLLNRLQRRERAPFRNPHCTRHLDALATKTP
jgi:hypothetical protein